ncbi:Putative uncharacterized protein [Moritella viscosa]|uniref:hypothetical protein n=1 Tax=Moritella viscosa TaxID=80854 RepID=UPI0009118842|nr:hypothetical protein [Moritella viscosa]SGZ08106.1 Putative uncharacterized protein [Moritella viscosa]
MLNENIFTERLLVSVTKVYRKKVSGLVAHAGVELNFEQGEPLVLHTNPENNTHISSIEEFLAGEVLVRKTTIAATQAIVDRINKRLSTKFKYSLADNCEHLVSEVLTGRPTSAQLKTSLTLSALGTVLFACKETNRNVPTLLFAALVCGGVGLYLEKQNQLSS